MIIRVKRLFISIDLFSKDRVSEKEKENDEHKISYFLECIEDSGQQVVKTFPYFSEFKHS